MRNINQDIRMDCNKFLEEVRRNSVMIAQRNRELRSVSIDLISRSIDLSRRSSRIISGQVPTR